MHTFLKQLISTHAGVNRSSSNKSTGSHTCLEIKKLGNNNMAGEYKLRPHNNNNNNNWFYDELIFSFFFNRLDQPDESNSYCTY